MYVSMRLNIFLETKGDRELFLLGALGKVPEGSGMVTLPITSRDMMTS